MPGQNIGLTDDRAASQHSGWHATVSAARASLAAIGLARLAVFDLSDGDYHLHFVIGAVAFIPSLGIELVGVSVAAGGWHDQGL